MGEDELLLGRRAGRSGRPRNRRGQAGGDRANRDSDDDFLLTPLEEAAGEESDSGSQVIALESDVEFEEAGGRSVSGGLRTGREESPAADCSTTICEAGLARRSPRRGGRTPAASHRPWRGGGALLAHGAATSQFSGWNVASLVLCAVLLMFCGMFMFDLLRNMWSWDGAYSVNSSLMDMVLSWFE